MPQSEHLMLGIQKVPSAPYLQMYAETFEELTPRHSPNSSQRSTPKSSPRPTPKSSPRPTPKSSPRPTPKSTPRPTPKPSPRPIPKICIHPAPETTFTANNGLPTIKYCTTYSPNDQNASVKKTAPPPPTTPANVDDDVAGLSLRRELQLTSLVLVCFVILIVVPLSMAIVGAVYVTSCPQRQMIPVFLIVSGSIFLLALYGLRKLAKRRETDFDWKCYKVTFWISVFLQFAWFLAGCYWIYDTYEPNYDSSNNKPYCNKSLYQYAFWLANSIFIVIAVVVIAFAIFITFGKLNAPKCQMKV